MRKVRVFIPAFIVIAALVSPSAVAGVTQPVSMTLAEPLIKTGCSVAIGFCGQGEVIPLGHATEALDLVLGTRTVSFADGSIVFAETLNNLECPGTCGSRSQRIPPVSGSLTDVVIGGTGAYVGASGTLFGSVHAAGLVHIVKLSGTLELPVSPPT